MNKITNSEIELVAEIFAEYESKILNEELGIEWLLSHAFQRGAKWMRNINGGNNE
jgi:hypothetical protein